MPNQSKQTTIPNLAGAIKTEDLYKKMKFDYVPWAKTAQILREKANGWMFHLQSSGSENDLFNYVFPAPNGTGYLMGYYEHIETGKKGPLYPFAITNNANQPIKIDQISSTHIQNSHRRCLCACACFTFGLAYELWAQIEIQEADQPEPVKPQGITRTPQRQPQSKQVVKTIMSEVAPTEKQPINPKVKEDLLKRIEAQPQAVKNQLVNDFRERFKTPTGPITPRIKSVEHQVFLQGRLDEINPA